LERNKIQTQFGGYIASVRIEMKQLVYLVFALALGNALADWYDNAVFYQIYPKSFKDSDGNGTGDLKGITSKLQHLKDLGVDGTWLSPIFESPQKDGGYDISDFETVDPLFGTNEDLDELFKEAKKLGIKIILDFVPNHTSDKHDWFVKSEAGDAKYKDYYVWRDAKYVNGQRIEPNNWVIKKISPQNQGEKILDLF
jgi:alpha-glucosidase